MMVPKRIVFAAWLTLTLGAFLLCGCSNGQEAKTYTFHNVYVGAEELIKTHKDDKSCEDIYLNEDGSLTLVLTEDQRKHWADLSETETILLPLKLMGVDVSYSDDYTKLKISAPDGVAEVAAPMISNFAWAAQLYQVLNGVEDWSLEVTVFNSDSGEMVQRYLLPQEDLNWVIPVDPS